VAEQRQGERRVDELPVGRDQREEQCAEPDEDEPVHDADERPLAQPGVPEGLDENGADALTGAAAAGGVRRPQPDHPQQVADGAAEQRHADEGRDGGDRDRRGLEGGQVHQVDSPVRGPVSDS
jgi:hypothetical protein